MRAGSADGLSGSHTIPHLVNTYGPVGSRQVGQRPGDHVLGVP